MEDIEWLGDEQIDLEDEQTKTAIVGTRTFDNLKLYSDTLRDKDLDWIVTGDAKGADTYAVLTAKERKIPVTVFHADWDKYGKKAGPIRNQELVSEADEMIAFWDGKSKGTKSSIDLMKQAGKPVEVIQYDE